MDSGGADLLKSPILPIMQVAPVRHVRGWVDDYANVEADVLRPRMLLFSSGIRLNLDEGAKAAMLQQ